MDRGQMEALIRRFKLPRYRLDQLYSWVFEHGVRRFEEMSNLPKSFRLKLEAEGYHLGRASVGPVREALDGTRKLPLQLSDGAVVESVLIPMKEGRFTQCLSSQVGCAMGCKFCYTGSLGLSRNLTPGEIIDQVLLARDLLPPKARVSHLVFMGMGEPLHNLSGVLASLKIICDPQAIGYSHRKVTVSTSGLVPQIEALGAAAPVNLAWSMNATTDELRDRIMPINRKWNIASVLAALRRYPLPPRRKMTIEYVLLGGLNDSDADARRLLRLLSGLPAQVNLLPWNPFQDRSFQRPSEERMRSFQTILLRQGLMATVRVSKGLEIDAACGQLGEAPKALSR